MYSTKEVKTLNKLISDLLQDSTLANHSEQVKETISSLKQAINYLDWRYYVQAESQVKDIDYDYLFDSLKQLEASHPEFLTEDSPTKRVARGLSDDFPTVNHTIPMLSLDKAYTFEQIEDWALSVKKISQTEDIVFAVEPKYDGSSIALIYENDSLVRGATRGNGISGDNVTNNIKTIRSIPLSANFSANGIARVELRGEVVIHKERFDEMNAEREKTGEKLFANSRNTAAGGLRVKDSQLAADRNMEAFIYQLGAAYDASGKDLMGQGLVSHGESVQLLYQLGFKTPLEGADDNSHMCKNIAEVIEYIKFWQERRASYPYEIDGIVIKVNDYTLQELCGATAHHPRWAIAFKFDARQAETILESIEFQVGRTGAITPVAKLQTVNLSGANISNASLHNEDFIRDKDIKIGDTVLLERAGDVIPYIVKSLPELRTGNEEEVKFPETCPSCSSGLSKPEGESIWRCQNVECPAQVEERIIHFVSKGALDIFGLGKDIVKRFFNDGLLSSIPDVFRLDYETIIELDGWGEKSVEKLKSSIETAKERPLSRLIIGLGIREVGNTTAKTLTEAINSIEELKNWSVEQLIELPDVGPKVAQNIVSFFSEESNLRLLAELKELGINMVKQEKDKLVLDSTALAGKSFLFTGSLQNFTRNDAKKLVETNGGRIISAVSTKLDVLVVGEKAGSKLAKAQKIGTIQILSEEEFLALLPQ